jgi:hypothetical protein
MHFTVDWQSKIESHQTDNDASKGQYSYGDIHDERPSPWPPSGVDFPFKFKSSNQFPPVPGLNGR